MNFVPSGCVTGIGSLPHLDPDEAVRFIAEFSAEIPFWPQLPQRVPSESMIPQMLSPVLDLLDAHTLSHYEIQPNKLKEFRRRLGDSEAKLSEEGASGFFAFERACQENTFQKAKAFKAQLTGPITLGWCLFYKGTPLSMLPDLYIELVGYVCRLAIWQSSTLQKFGKPIIVFIDEAMFEMRTSKDYLKDGIKLLIETIRHEAATSGIHCCATPAPTSLFDLQPDIVSFDAHVGLETFFGHSDVHRFIELGGYLSYGLVPTWSTLGRFSPSGAFVRWAMAANEIGSLKKLASQSLITASCGLGLLNIAAAQESFLKADELCNLIRKVIAS